MDPVTYIARCFPNTRLKMICVRLQSCCLGNWSLNNRSAWKRAPAVCSLAVTDRYLRVHITAPDYFVPGGDSSVGPDRRLQHARVPVEIILHRRLDLTSSRTRRRLRSIWYQYFGSVKHSLSGQGITGTKISPLENVIHGT